MTDAQWQPVIAAHIDAGCAAGRCGEHRAARRAIDWAARCDKFVFQSNSTVVTRLPAGQLLWSAQEERGRWGGRLSVGLSAGVASLIDGSPDRRMNTAGDAAAAAAAAAGGVAKCRQIMSTFDTTADRTPAFRHDVTVSAHFFFWVRVARLRRETLSFGYPSFCTCLRMLTKYTSLSSPSLLLLCSQSLTTMTVQHVLISRHCDHRDH